MISFEILIAISIIALFYIFSLLSYIPLLATGVIFIIAGLLFGIPVGLYYHIILFKRRRLLGEGFKKWWISPYRYHRYLPVKDRMLLNRWFWTGAMFFNLSMVGCGLVFISLFMPRD